MAVGRCGLLALAAVVIAVILPLAAAQAPGVVCDRPGVDTYAAELCKCKKDAKYCNPYCQGTYIQCGADGSADIKKCDGDKNYSFYTQQCEDIAADAPGVCPALPDTVGSSEGDPKPCTLPFCACDDLEPGEYPNPFDPSTSSYLVCEFVPGLAQGVKSQIKEIVECPSGYTYDIAKKECMEAPPGSPALTVSGGGQACKGVECFCRNRRRGLYLNPWDSDRATALRCNSKGQLTSLIPGSMDQYFNGRRFVKRPAGGLPPLCVLDSAGMRATGLGLKEAWDEMLAATEVPAVTPLPRLTGPPSAVVVTNSSGGGRPSAGRKLQQSFVSNCPGANFATGCGQIVNAKCWVVRGNPCRGINDGVYALYSCRIWRCGGGCPVVLVQVFTRQECDQVGGSGTSVAFG